MSVLVDQLSDEHVQLLESVNTIESDEQKITVAQAFLNELAQAGTVVADVRQRSKLRSFIRFWSSFVYDYSGLFPEVQLLPAIQSDISMSPTTDVAQQELGSKVISGMKQGVSLAQVGPFKIIAEIGEGNFSKVYRAINTLSEETVALKILQGTQLQQAHRLRESMFLRERLALALKHPNIIPIYSVAEYDGFLCTAMKLIESGSLRDRLSHWFWRPSIRTILNIILDAVKGIGYLHSHQIIHRDIQPANLLMTFDDHVYLTDFGITQVIGSMYSGMIVGTPEYLAPEAILSPERVDGRVDIYAIGIMLYELLTGAPPFRADSPTELLHLHINEPVPVLNLVPSQLGEVIYTCLKKNPQERFQNAKQLGNAINQLFSFLPTIYLDLQPEIFTTEPETRFKSHGTNALEIQQTLVSANNPKSTFNSFKEKPDFISFYENVDHYEIIAEISNGDISKVYKAFDPIHNRVVALKVLQEKTVNDFYRTQKRLLTHGLEITRLRHPNLVMVYEVLEQSGKICVAMQLIEGGSFAERLKHWKHFLPTIRTVLHIIIQVADALVYLHSQGVVHCNLKPDSILLSFDDHAYITNFGNGRFLNKLDNNMISTPAYAAPEIILDFEIIDGRADIYSLGVVLFEIFVGQLPFQANRVDELLYQHVNQPVPDTPYLQEEIAEVIYNCLEKDPTKRFQTAKEVKDKIEQLIADLPNIDLDSRLYQPIASRKESQPICLQCGGTNSYKAKFCRYCGNSLSHSARSSMSTAQSMAQQRSHLLCPRCGGINSHKAKFCRHCGNSL